MAKLITKQRRGLTSEWLAATAIPEDGELILEICEVCSKGEDCVKAQTETPNTSMCPHCGLHLDTTISEKKIKIGNGTSPFIDLPYVDEIVRQNVDSLETRLSEHVKFNGDQSQYGEGTPESELIDARVSYEGINYSTAGDAIRSVGEEVHGLKTSLADFINAKAVDGLYYEGNKLYLTASGVILEDTAVTIVSGTGTGTGGAVSSSVMSLKNLDGTNSFTAVSGEKVYLHFLFTSVEAEDETISTGNGSCKILVNGATKSTYNIVQGERDVEVSQWLSSGDNKIEIEVTDVYGAYRKLVYFVSVIELIISSDFISAQTFTGGIDFVYKAIGTVDKVAHFRLKGPDDKDYKEVATSAVIKAVNSTNTQTIPRPESNTAVHAVYSLDVYLTADIGPNNTISSDHLTYDVMFIMEGDDYDPLLASSYSVDEIYQGQLISIPYFLYDPADEKCDNVSFTIESNGETTTLPVKNEIPRTQQYWNISNYPTGNNVKFTISYTNKNQSCTVSKTHIIKINASNIDVSATESSLQLYLTAKNRTNSDANRDSWNYYNSTDKISYTSVLSNFNYQTNGWLLDENDEPCLRLNGDARAKINFQIFNKDFSTANRTIELDFAIRNVNDRSATPISCYDDLVGLFATPDKLTFKAGGIELNCSYKTDVRLRVSIVIEPHNQEQDSKFAKIYLNGVLSGITEYNGGFTQAVPQPLTLGSNLCELDIYNIRVYKRALYNNELINNYIYDLDNMNTKRLEFNTNDIYNKLTEELSYSQVKSLIPTVTFIGELPHTKGDKKKDSVRMIFEHPTNPSLNFDEILKELDVQGTSSAGYPRKNWKTKHHEKHVHMDGQIAAKVFCLKVDYAEGTGTHNTQNANLVETFYSEDIPVKKNVPSSLKHLNRDEVPKIRTTITGYPIAIFHLDTKDWNLINIRKEELDERTDIKFYAKGNFNYDKGAEDVFGFNDDCDVECWEFLQNTDTNSFLTPWPLNHPDYWEARYHPDLKMLEDLKESNQNAAASTLSDEMINRFKSMYEWVHSTARGSYEVSPVTVVIDDKTNLITFSYDLVIKNDGKSEDTYSYEIDDNGNVVLEDADPSQVAIVMLDGSVDKIVYKGITWDVMIRPSNNNFAGIYKSTKEIIPHATGTRLVETYVGIDGSTYEYDTDDYRLAKFIKEFNNYFNMHYTAVYYVYTFFALMVDQRAKNLFLTYWHDDAYDESTSGRWYPYFYDNDTSYGINNTGHLTYDYYHEDNGDNGKVGNANVYNGQNSVLWCNYRDAFPEVIQSTYAKLRNDGLISYNNITNTFVENGSSKWSASMYNEDAWNKYIVIGTKLSDYCLKTENNNDDNPDIVKDYFYQVRGDGEHHLEYFVENRIKYCDSKWHCGNYANDAVQIRIYTPQVKEDSEDADKILKSLSVVPANTVINLVPYSNMYCGVSYGSVSGEDPMQYLQQKYANRGEEVSFNAGNTNVNDKETYIYGASELSDIGDLAPLYPKLVTVSAAVKLKRLKIGDKDQRDYYNANLESVTVANNKLLEEIDVCNCPNFKGEFVVSGCNNIKEVYATGTSLTSIKLPSGGSVQKLYYPNTIDHLCITNQLFIEELYVGASDPTDPNCGSTTEFNNIRYLWLENTGDLDNTTILNNILDNQIGKEVDDGNGNPVITYPLNFIRVDGFNKSFTSINGKTGGDLAVEYLSRLFGRSGIKVDGSDDIGNVYLTGEIRVDEITGEQYKLLKDHIPYLAIKFDKMESYVTFDGLTGPDGETPYIQKVYNPEYTGQSVEPNGRTIKDPVKELSLKAPTKESDAQYTYTFVGWSRNKGDILTSDSQTPDADALKYILGDRTVYPVFRATINQYTARFFTSDKLIYAYKCDYGTKLKYDPEYAKSKNPLLVDESGNPIKQDTSASDLYIYTGFLPKVPDDFEITGDIDFYADFQFNSSDIVPALLSEFKVQQDDSNQTLSLLKYIAVPNDYSDSDIDEIEDNDAVLRIENTYQVTDQNGDAAEYTVVSIDGFTPGEKEIDGKKYNTSISVEYVELPTTLKTISSECFKNCNKLIEITIPESVTDIGYRAFEGCNSINKVTYNAKNARYDHSYDGGAFELCNSDHGINIVIGNNVTNIPEYLFYNRYSGESNKLVSSIIFETDEKGSSDLVDIGQFAFRESGAKTMILPTSVRNLGMYSFAYNKFKSISFDDNDNADCKIPSQLNFVDSATFSASENLETIKFNKVLKFGGAFASRCPKLTSIIITNTEGNYRALENCVIDVSSKEVIQGCKTSIVPSSLTEFPQLKIGNSAFKEVNIPVTNAEECNNILPQNIIEIGSSAFHSCMEINYVKIPKNVTLIGSSAFEHCENMHTLEFDSSSELRSIKEYAFWYCRSLNNVKLPSTINEISNYCFSQCTSLNTIDIPSSVTSFGVKSFQNTKFTEFKCNDSIKHIDTMSFLNCSSLRKFTFGSGISSVGGKEDSNSEVTYKLFEGCNNLTEIICPINSTHTVASTAPWGAPGRVTVRFNDTTKTYDGGVLENV